MFSQIKAFRQKVQSLMSANTQLPEVDGLDCLWLLSINTHITFSFWETLLSCDSSLPSTWRCGRSTSQGPSMEVWLIWPCQRTSPSLGRCLWRPYLCPLGPVWFLCTFRCRIFRKCSDLAFTSASCKVLLNIGTLGGLPDSTWEDSRCYQGAQAMTATCSRRSW